MKVWKLTDGYGETWGNTEWGEGVTHETNGQGGLCGPGWLHAYHHPLLAVLLNPIHADFIDPQLWEAEAEGEIEHDNGLKLGCTKLTTLRRVRVPKVTTGQRVRFGILCAKAVCTDIDFNLWADNWLSRADRSRATARAAAWAAFAAWAASAASAASSAASAASAEEAAAACGAARAAASAVGRATWAGVPIDLAALAESALQGN